MSAQRRLVAVESCLQPVELPKHRVQARDYRTEGLYPVVDQGQSDVSGWTDSADGLICNCLPVIVFGDHTRAVKYLDQPFVRGADGTQILKPRDDIDPEYFFFALCSIELESRGYNRHLQQLKAAHIPLVDLSAQQTIGRVLRLVREAIALNDRALATAEELHAAVMAHVFTYGLRGEPTKETEIGPIPESWEAESLGSVADIVSTRMSYADLERLEPSVDASAIPVWGVKVSDMNTPGNEVIFASASLAKALDLATAQQRAAPPDTVLLPKRGAAIATNKKRLAVVWTVFDPNVIGIRAKTGLDTKYLFHWLRSFDLRSITAAGPTPQINKKDLDPVCLPIPSVLEDQQMISSLIDSIDEVIRVSRAKKVLLEELFQSLLQRFFGEDQDDIDFEALATMLGEGSVA